MNFPDLDLAAYSRLPNVDTPTLIAFAERLLAVAPGKPAAPVKATLDDVRGELRALKDGYDAAFTVAPTADKRPIDQSSDTAWWCLDARLETAAALPAHLSPLPEGPVRAAELRRKLFPDGRRFALLEYGAQWAEMDLRMRLIEREKLRPDLEALCQAGFIKFLYETHEQYRVMAGAKPGASPAARATVPNLAELHQRLRRAITAHFVQRIAAYQAGGAKVKAALLPAFQIYDELRDKAAPFRPVKDEEPAAPGPAAPDPAVPAPGP
jgi:hypothetical protein